MKFDVPPQTPAPAESREEKIAKRTEAVNEMTSGIAKYLLEGGPSRRASSFLGMHEALNRIVDRIAMENNDETTEKALVSLVGLFEVLLNAQLLERNPNIWTNIADNPELLQKEMMEVLRRVALHRKP